ncbi:MAG: GldM family protein [Bacteroidia bacterium]
MAGGKISPRQKMINMMYLVLTALLAMNVTKEILLAFTVIDNSLIKSTANIDTKTGQMLDQLQKIAGENQAAAAALKHSEDTRTIAGEFVNKLHEIKTDLMRYVQGAQDPKDKGINPIDALKIPEDEAEKKDFKILKEYPFALNKAGEMPPLQAGDNLDDHVRYFNEELQGKRGKDLELMINKARVDMLAVIKEALKDTALTKNAQTKSFLTSKMNELARKTALQAGKVDDPFSTKSGKIKDSEGKEMAWAEVYMHSTPLAAVFAMLSKIENDAKLLESEVCQTLGEAVSAADYKFDAILPVVSAKTGAVVTGQTYEADIILAAYNSKANMKVFVNDREIPVEAGRGKYKVTPQSPGSNPMKVKIEIPKPGGGTDIKTAEAEFTAFAPQAAIAADAMNVLYEELDNPLTVSVGGVDPKNVIVSLVGAKPGIRLTGSGGKYTVKVARNYRRNKVVTVSVAAKLPEGIKQMGVKKFRIKNIPTPRFTLGPIVSWSQPINAGSIKNVPLVTAYLDGFAYENISYKVVAYEFELRRGGGTKQARVSGNSTSQIKQYLGMAKRGDVISFFNIQAKRPGGRIVVLDNVTAKIK